MEAVRVGGLLERDSVTLTSPYCVPRRRAPCSARTTRPGRPRATAPSACPAVRFYDDQESVYQSMNDRGVRIH